MEYPTLTKLFLDAADKFANPRAQMCAYRRGLAVDSPRAKCCAASRDFRKRLAQLGIQAGDRVALLAPNCPEWHIADFAVLGLGGVNVPIYFNESPERIVYILNDSGARLVIAAGAAQAQKMIRNAAHRAACDRAGDLRGPSRRIEGRCPQLRNFDRFGGR